MSSQTRRILIADDCGMIRRGIRSLLEMHPSLHVVAEASDGRIALDEARATQPNIVIIDYFLPGLSGVDLTSALKRELPNVEVLIFTLHDREDLLFEALRAGARAYVRKSDPEQHLLAAIDALSLHRHYFSGGVSERVLEQIQESTSADQFTLTCREREVVQLIAEGRMNKEVARLLDVSVKTVETHRASVMQKVKVRNTAQLVRYALRNKFLEA